MSVAQLSDEICRQRLGARTMALRLPYVWNYDIDEAQLRALPQRREVTGIPRIGGPAVYYSPSGRVSGERK